MAVIPLYNVLVLPESNVYLKTERYRKATGRMPRPEERIVLLLQRKKEPNDKLTPESFYPIGVSGVVADIHEEGWFTVRTRGRVNVDEAAILPDGHIEAYTSRREDTDVLSEQEQARRTADMKAAMTEFSKGTELKSLDGAVFHAE